MELSQRIAQIKMINNKRKLKGIVNKWKKGEKFSPDQEKEYYDLKSNFYCNRWEYNGCEADAQKFLKKSISASVESSRYKIHMVGFY